MQAKSKSRLVGSAVFLLSCLGLEIGYVGLPESQPYGSSKAGLIHILKAEYGKSIDIKMINPGFVESRLTDMNEFYMPFRITAEKALKRVSSGLNSRKIEIHFLSVLHI